MECELYIIVYFVDRGWIFDHLNAYVCPEIDQSACLKVYKVFHYFIYTARMIFIFPIHIVV
jgi:hypothetical protein